jgi:ribosome-associated protein YbcJ (S4-like RNA binding protein)
VSGVQPTVYLNGVPLMGETKKKLEDGDDISFAGKKYRYKAGEKNRN